MIFTMDNYIVGMIYKEISLFEWKYKVARREKDKEVGSIKKNFNFDFKLYEIYLKGTGINWYDEVKENFEKI